MALQIGIDLGGTSAKIGVVDDAYQIVARAEVPTGADIPFQVLVRAFADAIRAFPPALTGEVRSIVARTPELREFIRRLAPGDEVDVGLAQLASLTVEPRARR